MAKFLINSRKCFEKGLLEKTTPSTDLARKSLRQAKFFLEEGVDLVKQGKKEMSVIALYNSFFHAARALLFKDGVKERSHYCVARYVEDAYVKRKLVGKKFLDYLDSLRELRHDAQYAVETTAVDEDLRKASSVCRDFIELVEKLVG